MLSQISFPRIEQVQFEQLDSLQETEKRPVAVFLHTTWCKYFGTMKNATLKNNEFVNLLTQKFYFINLDIEEKQENSISKLYIEIQTYRWKHGVNELTEQLGIINGQVSNPAICFLNADYEIIHQHEGFVSPKGFLSILTELTAAMK